MTDNSNTSPKEWGELRKVVVFIPIDEISGPERNSASGPSLAMPSCSPDESEKIKPQNRDAARAEAKRLQWAAQGLTQINIVIKNTPEFRKEFAELAKRTITASSWSEVIRTDPLFHALEHTLESAKVRLLRIDDLEERHRRAYQSTLIAEAVNSCTGYKRLLLRLAGIVSKSKDQRDNAIRDEADSATQVTDRSSPRLNSENGD